MSGRTGRVYLVGAGPGDPELLTLKAVKALGAADVILVDELVNRAVLAHAPAHARIIEVGKRGACRSTPQALIERLMLAEARAGRTVVRLKGGDPCLFGRAGEEQAALARAGIAVEIVNGVTAGIAAPTALGIPVTHRDACRGVIFVTGHASAREAPDWQALAATGLTLIIYMGVARLALIVEELLAAGLAAATPVAVIENATLPAQRSITSTLRDAAAAVARAGLASPAIVVIGEVVAMAVPLSLNRIARAPRRAATGRPAAGSR